jgi:hypothetical protein
MNRKNKISWFLAVLIPIIVVYILAYGFTFSGQWFSISFWWKAFYYLPTAYLDWFLQFMDVFTFIFLSLMGICVVAALRNSGYSFSDSFGLSFFWLNFVIHPNGFLWHVIYYLRWWPSGFAITPEGILLGVLLLYLSIFYLVEYGVDKLLVFDRYVFLLYITTIGYHLFWLLIWAQSKNSCTWYRTRLYADASTNASVFFMNHFFPKMIQLGLFLAIWRKHFNWATFWVAPWRWKF